TLRSRSNHAVCLTSLGRLTEARTLQEENLRLSRRSVGPDHYYTVDSTRRLAEVLNLLAVVQGWRKGRYREALVWASEAAALLEPVVQRHPRDRASQVTLAMVCNTLAALRASCPDPRFRSAREALLFAERAVQLNPNERVIWNGLGMAHYRNGDLDAAE